MSVGSRTRLYAAGEVQCLGGEDVEEVSHGVELINPEGGGNGRLKQKRADHIVLGGRVGA